MNFNDHKGDHRSRVYFRYYNERFTKIYLSLQEGQLLFESHYKLRIPYKQINHIKLLLEEKITVAPLQADLKILFLTSQAVHLTTDILSKLMVHKFN